VKISLLLWVSLVTAWVDSTALQSAESRPVIQLWPKGAPGEKGDIGPEKDTTTDKENLVAGKRLIRLGNVTDPTLTIYPAKKSKNRGAMVMVCPGGGYHILALDLEGTEVCEWLNANGINAALLKYRVPVRKDQERFAPPLQDAQRALGILRERAAEWNVQPDRIGVLGFSAGGHLSAALSTNYEQRKYEPLDSADKVSCRPDFTVLVYPGYLSVKEENDKVRPELAITDKTPPTFIVMAQDDPVRVEGALAYYAALHKAKVPAEMHLYPSGGHGYGLRDIDKNVANWPNRVKDWMRESGFAPKP
jgi:acetyl esterase/lipase